MVFMWPFLSLFSPITSHNGQVFMGLHDPTNHCSKSTMPIVQIMGTITLWNVLDIDHCAHLENTRFCPNSSRAPYQAQWRISGTSHNTKILDSYPTLQNLFMNSSRLFQCSAVLSVVVHLQLNHNNGFPLDGGVVGAGSRNQFRCLPINPLHTLVHAELHGQLPHM
jgi:hypothetical protein